MKIQISQIDQNGFFVEPILTTQDEIDRHLDADNDFTLGNVVIDKVPQGLHQPKWDSTNEKWVEGKPSDDLLKEAKKAKIAELDQACSATILQGFDHTINSTSYHFSLSIPAQMNISGTDSMFKDGATTSENWTVVNNSTGEVERISLDETTFNEVRDIARSVIRDNVSKLRDTLEPQVEDATTVSEVKDIVW